IGDTACVAPLVPPFVAERGYYGWKLLRIPIAAFVPSSGFGAGSPDWHDIKHARVWVSGARPGNRIAIGGMDLVGNRWQLPPVLAANNGPGFRVTTVNNKDNQDYRVPPGVE